MGDHPCFSAGWKILLIVIFLCSESPPVLAEETVTNQPTVAPRVTGESPGISVDLSRIKTTEWEAAIRKATESTPLHSGNGQYSLFRVILEGAEESARTQAPNPDRSRQIVNGVPLFIPGEPIVVEEPTTMPAGGQFHVRDANLVQLAATKLITPWDGDAGGRYKQMLSGGFVLLEHINSASRRNSRDYVKVGSFVNGQGEIWVPVPPRGQLGIVGDIVMKRVPASELGRLIVEVIDASETRININSLLIGTVVSGGIYGQREVFTPSGVAASNFMGPGNYKIVLPDFDQAKSRWDVSIKPGAVTYIRLIADSQRSVRLDQIRQLKFESGTEPASPPKPAQDSLSAHETTSTASDAIHPATEIRERLVP